MPGVGQTPPAARPVITRIGEDDWRAGPGRAASQVRPFPNDATRIIEEMALELD